MTRLRGKRMKPPAPETLGARIKRLRLARGLSQPDLASLIHVDHATVSRWETDRRIPQRGPRAGLTAALGVSWQELSTGVGHELPATAPDRRRPTLKPLRDAVSRVQAIGDEALTDFVADVVALAHRWQHRKR